MTHLRNSILFFALVFLASCKRGNVIVDNNNQRDLNSLMQILKNYPYASSYQVNDSNVFMFLKARDEYHDSWVYFIKESDSTIDVDFRVLPSFTKTGYDSYHSDSNHFVFYEGYRMMLRRDEWDPIIKQSLILAKPVKDTVHEMDQGFGTPNYLLWYKSNLLVCHVDSKHTAMFKQLDTLLSNSLYKRIEYRRNNPNTRFTNGPLLPRGNLTE